MFEILGDYSFWTVALGTCLLALSASTIGTISVLTRQSMIGDGLGHASYPGVIFAFILFQSRQPLVLMLGAVLSGYLSYGLVYWLRRYSRHSLTNILAVVAASFFGLGMVLKQFVQGNPRFANSAQAGLQTYLFGQAAFIQKDDVVLIGVVGAVALLLFVLLYQSFKVYLFDETFAQVVGVPVRLLQQVTMWCVISLIAVGLKVVGAVLMSSFLIAPAVFGLLLGKTYPKTLFLSALSAVSSALVGTWVSSVISGLSTGPSIIICMTMFVLVAFIQSTYIRKENTHV